MDEPQHTIPTAEPCLTGSEAAFSGEPAFSRYVRLLWRRRALLGVGSLLPALLVGLLLSLWPRKYSATFVYERPLAESEYSVLLRRFYSQENLDKIVGRLREQGLTEYAGKLLAPTERSFERLIRFEVAPMYPKRLQTTDPTTSERISAFQAQLLLIRIMGNSRKEVSGVAAVVTGNVESILPMYEIRKAIKDSIQRFKTRAAEIEDSRFNLMLDLQREKAKLEKLKELDDDSSGTEGVILQFTDVQNSQEFLPLSYQVRAVQSKIIDLEETLTSDRERYDYYLHVLDLNNRLLARIEESLLSYYTVQQFLDFLGQELLACKDGAVCDYLKSYIRETQNLILVNTRAGENPVVYPVPKYIVKSSALTWIVCLMVAALAAVLLECRQERHRPT